MSVKYDDVKNFYDRKLWSDFMVMVAVKRNWITKEEFNKITHKLYDDVVSLYDVQKKTLLINKRKEKL